MTRFRATRAIDAATAVVAVAGLLSASRSFATSRSSASRPDEWQPVLTQSLAVIEAARTEAAALRNAIGAAAEAHAHDSAGDPPSPKAARRRPLPPRYSEVCIAKDVM